MHIREILSSALQTLVSERIRFGKALAVPIALYFALDFVPEDTHFLIDVFLALVVICLYTAICVATHRLLLVGPDSIPEWGLRRVTLRELLFAICIAALYGGIFLIGAAIYFAPIFDEIQRLALIFVLAIPASYVIARLSFVLPAIAVDSLISFADSWVLTRGKPVFVLLILVPGVLGIFSGMIAMLFGPLHAIAQNAMDCLLLVYEIAILSMLYKSVQVSELGKLT